ncbi:MAG: hypothetical protein ACLFVB_10570 [Thermoplasmata archaeon]
MFRKNYKDIFLYLIYLIIVISHIYFFIIKKMLFKKIYFISVLTFAALVILRILILDTKYKTWINAEIKPLRRIGIVLLVYPSLINSFNSDFNVSIPNIIAIIIIGIGLIYIALNLRKWYFSLNGFVSSEKSIFEIEDILDQKSVEYEKQKKDLSLSQSSSIILNLNNVQVMHISGRVYLKVDRIKNKKHLYKLIDMIEQSK